ncbi:MAG TPA: hypothetical protein VLE97_01695 [Gaiellaceae bacterium]|nr:hypothetical protein [Gaiellaceae bacterium]
MDVIDTLQQSSQWQDYTVTLPDGKTGGCFGRCRPCGYTFLIGFLPMPLDAFCNVVSSARCPCCGGNQILMSKVTEVPCSSAT